MLANVAWWAWIYIGLSLFMLFITFKADADENKSTLSRLEGLIFFIAIIILTIISFSIESQKHLDVIAKGLLIYLAISFIRSLYDEFIVVDSKQPNKDESFGFKVATFLMMSSFMLPAIILGVLKTKMLQGYWLWMIFGGAFILTITVWLSSKLRKSSLDDRLAHIPEDLRGSVRGAIERVQQLELENQHYYANLEASQIAFINGAFKQDGLINDAEEPSFKNREDIRKYLASAHSDKVLTFDVECIENQNDYKNLLQSFIKITNGKIAIEEVSSSYDCDSGKAFLYFIHDGNEYNWEISQTSDWVSSDYFNYLLSFAAELDVGEFLVYPAEDQCMTVVFLPVKSSIVLRELKCLMPIG